MHDHVTRHWIAVPRLQSKQRRRLRGHNPGRRPPNPVDYDSSFH